MKYLTWVTELRGDWWDEYWNQTHPAILSQDAMVMWFGGGEL